MMRLPLATTLTLRLKAWRRCCTNYVRYGVWTACPHRQWMPVPAPTPDLWWECPQCHVIRRTAQ